MDSRFLIATTLALAMAAAPERARAAELKVLAGGALTQIMRDLVPRFEGASGHKLVVQFGGTPELIRRATSGAPFDVAVVPVDVMKDAGARAKFAAGATTDIARVGFGVAVRAGAPKPDLSNAAAFKAALLGAQSLALFRESAAGAYIGKVFERLGIAEAMQAKTKPQGGPAQIVEAVARGEAELGLFLMNVLSAPGVEVAGPFPAEFQQDLVFTGAVAADAAEPDAAQAFIAFLQSEQGRAAFTAGGMRPG